MSVLRKPVSFFKKIFQGYWVENTGTKQSENSNNNFEGLYMSQQQVGWALAGIVLMSFFIFIAGYFLGQQRAAEQFSARVDQESLADKIYSSLYSLYDAKPEENDPTALDDKSEKVDDQQEVLDHNNTQEDVVQDQHLQASSKGADVQDIAHNEPLGARYYAQLAGFGAHKNAILFVRKLEKKGVAATVRTRYSRTARGKKIAWYQVITDEYTSEQELQKLVEKLKQEDRLQDVRIVTVND